MNSDLAAYTGLEAWTRNSINCVSKSTPPPMVKKPLIKIYQLKSQLNIILPYISRVLYPSETKCKLTFVGKFSCRIQCYSDFAEVQFCRAYSTKRQMGWGNETQCKVTKRVDKEHLSHWPLQHSSGMDDASASYRASNGQHQQPAFSNRDWLAASLAS